MGAKQYLKKKIANLFENVSYDIKSPSFPPGDQTQTIISFQNDIEYWETKPPESLKHHSYGIMKW